VKSSPPTFETIERMELLDRARVKN